MMHHRTLLDIDEQMQQALAQRASINSSAIIYIPSFETWECLFITRWFAFYVLVMTVAIMILVTQLLTRLTANSSTRKNNINKHKASVDFLLISIEKKHLAYTQLLIITVNIIFATMREFAPYCTSLNKEKTNNSLSSNALSIRSILLSASAFLWAIEIIGVTGWWIINVLAPKREELAVITSFLALLPAFYRSLIVVESDPNRIAVWCTHITFLFSLTVFATFLLPWIKREYNSAIVNIRQHTLKSIYSEREQIDDLLQREKLLCEKKHATNKS